MMKGAISFFSPFCFFCTLSKLRSVFFIMFFGILSGHIHAKTEVRVALGLDKIPLEFNPFDGEYDDLVKGTLYEPLVIFNLLTGEKHYRLAESYEFSQDLKKLTYKLRDNLKWSDGKPLTADDVVFSINLAKRFDYVDLGGLWRDKTLRSVRARGNRTVEFRFNKINTTADLLVSKYYIVPQHVWSTIQDPKSIDNESPVGSGPLTVVDAYDEKSLRLCRNPNYYLADEPKVDCIHYLAIQGSEKIQNALVEGDIDWGIGFVANVEKNFVQANKDHHGYWYPPEGLINLYLNTRSAPLNDIVFRQSISMSLDRETIVDLAAYGYPTSESHVIGLGRLFKAYFNERINSKYDYLSMYLPHRVKKKLDQAGYKDLDEDGYRELPNGDPFKLSIMAVGGWPDWEQAILMVSEYLTDVGIRAVATPVDWNTYDKALKEGTYDIAMNWSMTDVDPIITYRDYYHTSRVGKSWQAGHGVNSRKVDRWIEQYTQTQNTEKRQDILNQLMKFTAENLPFIPLWSNPTWFQYNSSRIVGWPTEENPYVNPWFYDGGSKLLMFNRLSPRETP